jgi:putative ABC transport system permease protein
MLDPARRAEPEAVISDRVFRRWFGGDPSALGSTIELGGRPFAVVGVAPAGFEGTFLGVTSAIYVAIDSGAHLVPPATPLELLARLTPESSLESARRRLAALPTTRTPDGDAVVRPRTLDGLDPSTAGGLAALLAAMATLALVVLATAAANVGGLLAARAVERRGELGLRSALGAPRTRLIRPLLLEASLLGVAGGGAAVVLSLLALRLLGGLAPRFSVPLALDLSPGVVTVAAAVACAWLLGTAAGIAPATAVGRAERLVEAIGFGRGAPKSRRARAGFVVGQLALALALVAAGLALTRGVGGAARYPLGFEESGLFVLDLEMQAIGGDNREHLALASGLEHRARESALVEAVGLLDQQLFAPGGLTVRPRLDDGTDGPELAANALSPGALAALGIELLEGRDFVVADVPAAPAVALVDRAAAERLWPGKSPLGRTLRLGDQPVEIVGVTAPARLRRPWLEPQGQLFRPFAQAARGRLALVVRSRSSAGALQRELLPTLAAAAADLPLDRFAPLRERIDLLQLPQRIAARTASALSTVAVALAALGLVGLVSRLAYERRREFSIRAALGADTRSIAGLVLAEGARLAGIGAALGLPLAVAVGFALAAVLERVAPADPVGLAGAAAAVALLAVVAAALPAWRAARQAPADILRE